MLETVRFAVREMRQLAEREEGANLAEYAILLGLIVVVTAAVVTGLATAIQGQFSAATGAL